LSVNATERKCLRSRDITRATNPFQAIKDGAILTMGDCLSFNEGISFDVIDYTGPAGGICDLEEEFEHENRAIV
jgi:hypothetical protein